MVSLHDNIRLNMIENTKQIV
uniref:Uncharacterized protein n=1 Tax=Anguilla anguilla TaxID=7936 RepID=A0A0E9TRP8_ANGAN